MPPSTLNDSPQRAPRRDPLLGGAGGAGCAAGGGDLAPGWDLGLPVASTSILEEIPPRLPRSGMAASVVNLISVVLGAGERCTALRT